MGPYVKAKRVGEAGAYQATAWWCMAIAKRLPLAETTEPGAKRAVMLGALPTARERHLAGSAHGDLTG